VISWCLLEHQSPTSITGYICYCLMSSGLFIEKMGSGSRPESTCLMCRHGLHHYKAHLPKQLSLSRCVWPQVQSLVWSLRAQAELVPGLTVDFVLVPTEPRTLRALHAMEDSESWAQSPLCRQDTCMCLSLLSSAAHREYAVTSGLR
jgi:hypothetical protein